MTGDNFEALPARNLPSVRRFVQTRPRTSDQADDVIRQTLLPAFAQRDDLRACSKFKSCLCSIAGNEVALFFRLDEFPQIESRDCGPSPLAFELSESATKSSHLQARWRMACAVRNMGRRREVRSSRAGQ